ncbi:hypothetical protein JX580_05105 [Thiomicrospira microaerophila]|uniref:glycosyltransferase family 2 protein n=1 Tax=Thiomicrospira microaerophila TaxID=406020 RepID=UPI00200CA9F7|nr:hypothetical protein [Thiomicrospira microaerophila]UQB43255.1 hypothetical protein JX580_05105 [Thiomicrospira microaerophila]
MTATQHAAYVPQSLVIHHESKTPGRGQYIQQNRQIFYERWHKQLKPDDQQHYQQDGMIPADIKRDHSDKPNISAIKISAKPKQ